MKSYYEAVDIITEASLYLHQVHATRKFSFGPADSMFLFRLRLERKLGMEKILYR